MFFPALPLLEMGYPGKCLLKGENPVEELLVLRSKAFLVFREISLEQRLIDAS